jgi:hypothetical protein
MDNLLKIKNMNISFVEMVGRITTEEMLGIQKRNNFEINVLINTSGIELGERRGSIPWTE